jgi:hypothetical protein
MQFGRNVQTSILKMEPIPPEYNICKNKQHKIHKMANQKENDNEERLLNRSQLHISQQQQNRPTGPCLEEVNDMENNPYTESADLQPTFISFYSILLTKKRWARSVKQQSTGLKRLL